MQVSIHAIASAMQELECNEDFSSIPETPASENTKTLESTPVPKIAIKWPQRRFTVHMQMQCPTFVPIQDYTFLRSHVRDIPHNERLLSTIVAASMDDAFGWLFSMVYFLMELQNRTLWMLPGTNDSNMTSYAHMMLQNTSEWGVPYMEAKHTKLKHNARGRQVVLCTRQLCYSDVCNTAASWLPSSPHMQCCDKLLYASNDVKKLTFMLRARRDVVKTIVKKFDCKLAEDAHSVEHNDIHDVMFVTDFLYSCNQKSSTKRQKFE